MVGLFLASSLKFSKFDLIQQPLAEASPPRRCCMGWGCGGGTATACSRSAAAPPRASCGR